MLGLYVLELELVMDSDFSFVQILYSTLNTCPQTLNSHKIHSRSDTGYYVGQGFDYSRFDPS